MYDRKKTLNEAYKNRIDEIIDEAWSPLKDKTSMNTPSELKSNADANMGYSNSDHRKHSTNSKFNISNKTNKTIDKVVLNSK